jgi:hypothetical protein
MADLLMPKADGAEFTVLRKPYQLTELSRALVKARAELRQPASSNLVHLRDARRSPPKALRQE